MKINIELILKCVNLVINIFIGVAILTGILALLNVIFDNPQSLGIWIGNVIDGISSITAN